MSKKAVAKKSSSKKTERKPKKKSATREKVSRKQKLLGRRYDLAFDLFVNDKVTRSGERDFDTDADNVVNRLGAELYDDPFRKLTDEEKKQLTDEEFQRIVLDLLHGPTTIAPTKEGGHVALDWKQFPIAYGPKWLEKWKIASLLLSIKSPGADTPLLFPDGVLVIGPGGTAFHVALQIAWRLRAKTETGSTDVFENDEVFREIHTDSFEVARLLSPLAVDPAPEVYLSGTLVSRYGNRDREKLSILTNSPAQPRKGKWIDALVIGCQHIDENGTIFTWAYARHKETIEEYLTALKGQLFVVCSADKIGRGGQKRQSITNPCPKDNAYIVTNWEPRVKPKGFAFMFHPEKPSGIPL